MKNYRRRPLGPIGIEPIEAKFLVALDAIHNTQWAQDIDAGSTSTTRATAARHSQRHY